MIRRLPFVVALMSATSLAADGGESSSIDRLADAVFARARAQPLEGPVGVFSKSASPDLARAFSTILIARLSNANLGGVPIEAPDPAAAESKARSIGTRALIRVDIFLSGGELHSRGDLLSTWVNFWSGKVPTRAPQPAAIIEAAVPADATALALGTSSLKPELLAVDDLRLSVEKIASVPATLSAIAAGDINGDGAPEILALTEDDLFAFDSSGRVLGTKSLRAIPYAASRCREPFGSMIVLRDPPRVAYALANRAHGEVVTLDSGASTFRTVQELEQVPVTQWQEKLVSTAAIAGQNLYGRTLVVQGDRSIELKQSFQSFSSFSQAGKEWFLFTFADRTGSLFQQDPGSTPLRNFLGLGAASVLVDLRGSGSPQLVSTSPEYNPGEDELRLLPLDKTAPIRTVPLGPGKAWYVARMSRASAPDEVVVGIIRPTGIAELLRIRRQP